jgi:3-oxoacyl-[acyl-carrier-protein] synthase-3
MDGPELVRFTLEVVPTTIERILADAGLSTGEVDYFLMHQATLMMLQRLRDQLKLDEERLPVDLEECGNTVSSTLPILMHDLRSSQRLRPGKRSVMIGFGVGLSWAGCLWTETWAAQQQVVESSSAHKAA